ncbi:hypothetical protein DFJ43DRAFT_1228418 [Lentinula guzmanii]|uniref:Uncharacterized protein n=1 Tax=Lentinula guzmanii TaxID=2804957 RepID=A0AA38J9G3_9AGAR|nr:hypothetical protein DFJ43DRAFT_1228418 [Lentinula guzmanii]
MHLRLGLWITALILGLIHPILGAPTWQSSLVRVKQDPKCPGKILNEDEIYTTKVFVRFKTRDTLLGTYNVEPLDLEKPEVDAATLMFECLLHSAWQELKLKPSVRWSTCEVYGVTMPEIEIDNYGLFVDGWTPAKELKFTLTRWGVQVMNDMEIGYMKPIPGEEGTYEIYVKGLVKKTVNIGSEKLEELRKLVPFEWPKK